MNLWEALQVAYQQFNINSCIILSSKLVGTEAKK